MRTRKTIAHEDVDAMRTKRKKRNGRASDDEMTMRTSAFRLDPIRVVVTKTRMRTTNVHDDADVPRAPT
jgi:hypothetical protein